MRGARGRPPRSTRQPDCRHARPCRRARRRRQAGARDAAARHGAGVARRRSRRRASPVRRSRRGGRPAPPLGRPAQPHGRIWAPKRVSGAQPAPACFAGSSNCRLHADAPRLRLRGSRPETSPERLPVGLTSRHRSSIPLGRYGLEAVGIGTLLSAISPCNVQVVIGSEAFPIRPLRSEHRLVLSLPQDSPDVIANMTAPILRTRLGLPQPRICP